MIADVSLTNGERLTREFKGLPGVTDPTDKFRGATGNHSAVSAVPELARTMRSEDDLYRFLDVLGQRLT